MKEMLALYKGAKIYDWTLVSDETIVKDDNGHNWAMYDCVCACGTKKQVHSISLRRSDSKNCKSCKQKKTWEAYSPEEREKHIKKTHSGLNLDPLYNSWRCMKGNASSTGIAICKEWLDFENFRDDMEPRPEDAKLMRKDKAKGWTKTNTMWDRDTTDSLMALLKKLRAMPLPADIERMISPHLPEMAMVESWVEEPVLNRNQKLIKRSKDLIGKDGELFFDLLNDALVDLDSLKIKRLFKAKLFLDGTGEFARNVGVSSNVLRSNVHEDQKDWRLSTLHKFVKGAGLRLKVERV